MSNQSVSASSSTRSLLKPPSCGIIIKASLKYKASLGQMLYTLSNHKGKRSREDFKVSYPKFVRAARKKVFLDQPDSSASESHDHHVIFFIPFLSYPMVFDIVHVYLYVDPKHWATAFMQADIRSIADILCRAIFTEEDIQNRNKCGVQNGLPSIKQLAILRASKWMMNKKQDPWSFKFNPEPEQAIDAEEGKQIMEVFHNLDSVYPFHDFYIWLHNEDTTEGEVTSTTFTTTIDNGTMSCTDQNKMDPCWEEELIKIVEDFQYTDAFIKVAKLGILGNAAQTAKELTKISIESNTDIFVDAVQFSKGRWDKALRQDDIVSMANVLFRKYWKEASKHSAVSSLADLCAVTRLAILRAAAWMKTEDEEVVKDRSRDPYAFNSAIPHHNVYPSPEEVKDIENKVFRQYLGISSCAFNTGLTIPLQSVAASVENDHVSLAQLNLNVNNLYAESQSLYNSETSQSLVPKLVSNIPTELKNGNSASSFESATKTSLDQDSNTSSSSSASNSRMDSLHPSTVSKPIIINKYKIAQDIWDKAFTNFTEERQDAALRAGKYLFQQSFDIDELRNQTYSGRGGKPKLSEDKTNGILDSLSIMKALADSGREISEFQYQGEGVRVQAMSAVERQGLITKIFSEHRNYLANKAKR